MPLEFMCKTTRMHKVFPSSCVTVVGVAGYTASAASTAVVQGK